MNESTRYLASVGQGTNLTFTWQFDNQDQVVVAPDWSDCPMNCYSTAVVRNYV